MSFLFKIGAWLAKTVPKVVDVAKKVGSFLFTAAKVSDALMKGDELAKEVSSNSREIVADRGPRDDLADSRDRQMGAKMARMDHELAGVKRALASQAHAHKLALMITELRVFGEMLRGISANIEMHSSNLRIHLHTIKNTTGLLNDVNRQRVAIKNLSKNVDYLFEAMGKSHAGRQRGALDVEKRMGDISIKEAHDAYGETRQHLIDEVVRFGQAIDDQWGRIDAVAKLAESVPQRGKIQHWLNAEVKPGLRKANDSAADLFYKINNVSVLEDQVVYELSKSE